MVYTGETKINDTYLDLLTYLLFYTWGQKFCMIRFCVAILDTLYSIRGKKNLNP